MYTMGFIGTGNMGSALALAASKSLPGSALVLSNRTPAKAKALGDKLGCETGDNALAASKSKFIFLGVKPQMMAGLLTEISPILGYRREPFVLVTMAAGLTIARIREMAGGNYPVIRIMPNTPCAIGSGVILCCRSANVSDEDYAQFKAAMASAGTLTELSENLIDAGSAISGCGPAFVYTFIEAMADAGVSCGLTRKAALELAAATVKGSAEMVMQGDLHPAQLRDNVCSPGGSTIAGVLSMDAGGFRAAVANGVLAACQRTKELGK